MHFKVLWAITNSEKGRQVGIEAYKRLAQFNMIAKQKLAVLTGQGEKITTFCNYL